MRPGRLRLRARACLGGGDSVLRLSPRAVALGLSRAHLGRQEPLAWNRRRDCMRTAMRHISLHTMHASCLACNRFHHIGAATHADCARKESRSVGVDSRNRVSRSVDSGLHRTCCQRCAAASRAKPTGAFSLSTSARMADSARGSEGTEYRDACTGGTPWPSALPHRTVMPYAQATVRHGIT